MAPSEKLSHFLKTLRHNPGPSFSLADVFLFAQIPFLPVAVAATIIAGYVFLRSTSGEEGSRVFDSVERPFAKGFHAIHPWIPVLNEIKAEEFNKGKPGAAMLTVGVAQLPVFFASLAIAVLNPLAPLGWMAAVATGFFAGSNIKAGIQMNEAAERHLNKTKTEKKEQSWRDVASSTQVLDAAGLCCSGLMAGLATSFGLFVVIPIIIALVSAALVAAGKIGKVSLNTGIPMAALSAGAILNTAVGIANGHWLAALSNGASVNGELLLTKFYYEKYKKEYAQSRPKASAKGTPHPARLLFYRDPLPETKEVSAPLLQAEPSPSPTLTPSSDTNDHNF